MGSKTEARERMRAAGVPIIPGTTEPVESRRGGAPARRRARLAGRDQGLGRRRRQGLPGRRARPTTSSVRSRRRRREGEAYFSDPAVYVERYLEDPRHVEVQVLADAHGNVIHLGERDCTIQRRHQKLVEETPSPAVDDELRARIGAIAVEAARAVGYRSAGTIEGLLDRDGEYFFMEMNTRIQVEHTVTELVTGLDLVREQVLIAAGEPLSLRQEDVRLSGHAIECRINAEDPSAGFRPAPGRIAGYREPGGPGVRVDSGVEDGSEISRALRPDDREADRARGRPRARAHADAARARRVRDRRRDDAARLPPRAASPPVLRRRARRATGSSSRRSWRSRREQLSHATTTVAAGRDGRLRERVTAVELDGRRFDVRLLVPEPPWAELAAAPARAGRAARPRRRRPRRDRQPDAGHRPVGRRSPRAMPSTPAR